MMTYRTSSGRPTFYSPADPAMTGCCHSTAEWCSRPTWREALEHALERARAGNHRQCVYRERNGVDGYWLISIYGPDLRYRGIRTTAGRKPA